MNNERKREKRRDRENPIHALMKGELRVSNIVIIWHWNDFWAINKARNKVHPKKSNYCISINLFNLKFNWYSRDESKRKIYREHKIRRVTIFHLDFRNDCHFYGDASIGRKNWQNSWKIYFSFLGNRKLLARGKKLHKNRKEVLTRLGNDRPKYATLVGRTRFGRIVRFFYLSLFFSLFHNFSWRSSFRLAADARGP